MTEQREQDLYVACRRDLRRQFIIFLISLLVVSGALGTGWILSAIGRDAWKAQADVWRDWGMGLYDEYTQETGEEPMAPSPDVISEQGPQGEPGEAGPVGPSGTPGRDGEDGEPGAPGQPGAPGVQGLQGDQGAPGVAGSAGSQGEQGPAGPAGAPGSPGAPGPQGPAGPPGPIGPSCPDGYDLSVTWIMTSDSELGVYVPTQSAICTPILEETAP